MRIAIVGAAGRMGKALARLVHETPGVELSGGTEPPGAPAIGADVGEIAGLGHLGAAITADALELFKRSDGVLDFTAPDASVAHAGFAAEAGIVHVIGTTGFQQHHEDAIASAAQKTVIVKAGNMSLGVNLLAVMVKRAAAALGPEFDIEILEMHHRMKVDAPSGTALLLGQAAAEGRDIALADHSVRVRDGHTGARGKGDIGFATLRGGDVVGEHTVMFAGLGERVEFTHKASDRQIFARGAVTAARWGHGKAPGLYSMQDVLGL
ncbi:MAG: 4-hydroxy-tetrahydrodipicolinate reductase [Alphaproteobacteria bacterium]